MKKFVKNETENRKIKVDFKKVNQSSFCIHLGEVF